MRSGHSVKPRSGSHVNRARKSVAPKRRSVSRPRVSPLARADPRYETNGGWKVHLTVGKHAYGSRVAAIKRWLKRYFSDFGPNAWKHLDGGDRHQKDFTIYLGSYATMVQFVAKLEASAVCRNLDQSNAGSADRIIGSTGRCAARFDPRGVIAGRGWRYGWQGIPFKEQDAIKRLAGVQPQRLASFRKSELRQMFGDYFLPEGVE
jgi:hypothetical protein